MYKLQGWIISISLILVFFSTDIYARRHVFLVPEMKHDSSPPLNEMHGWVTKERANEITPMFHLPSLNKVFVSERDVVAQFFPGAPLNVNFVLNFLGLGIGLGNFLPKTSPPDTTGAPGLTQYVQIVNTSLAIFNKANGALEYGPVNTNTIWSGFGGVCETTNQGDAIVKYDQLANRWVISQFAFNLVNDEVAPPFVQCIAVSKTADARLGYYRYAFEFANFNDFGKIGLSPKAYFMSFFMFNNGNFLGPKACAFPRVEMLFGKPAVAQCFNPGNTMIDLVPADLDGLRLPPANTPEFYLSLNKQTHQLYLWKFKVNWQDANKSSFKGPIIISAISPFRLPCADRGERDPDEQMQGCIPQPNSNSLLDALDDRLGYRLAYRQFNSHGTLVINHTVGGATALTGVRWYQLNISNADKDHRPRLIQQGTFTPDQNNRWMGSIAIDKKKNIALGYSVSNFNVFPSIAITGRMHSDPHGILRNEITVAPGSGSQTATFRWGDYSTMSVDPIDNCTFWYTTEYLQITAGEGNWSTRITAFRFPNCV